MKTQNVLQVLTLALLVGLFSCCKIKTDVCVATFNVRYDNPNDSANNWKYRRDSICKFVTRIAPDVIGMQEVLHHQLTYMMNHLPHYAYVGVGRDDGKEAGEYAPILYQKNKYDLIQGNTFWLSEHPDSVALGWDAACIRIATWAKLKNKLTGEKFMMVNTHFDHVGKLARKNSALLIINKIKEIAGDLPTIVTGDFNVSEEWEVYSTMTTNSFKLNDAWKVAEEKQGIDYTYHDFGRYPQNKREKIDYIFITPNITVKKAVIKDALMNNSLYMSDHNPHYADITF